MASEDDLRGKLQALERQLGKKQMFEEAVSSINSLLRQSYPSASPSLQKLFYSVVCRVATVLRTRYTSPGFWAAGLVLFKEAQQLVSETSEREHLRGCIAKAQEELHEVENQPEVSESAQNSASRGFLFEGHLTVDPEPPQPQWMVQSNLLASIAAMFNAESSEGEAGNNNTSESTSNLIQQIIDSVPLIMDDETIAPRAPPASKEVVAKLAIITITEEILVELGPDAECAICKENLVVSDKMQELPCKHTFHPPCLKPWLDEHNSCPICRHELQTDDHAYESWKEKEKEAAEERRGAANAVRGGEYMYV